jgi:hypothetical protein
MSSLVADGPDLAPGTGRRPTFRYAYRPLFQNPGVKYVQNSRRAHAVKPWGEIDPGTMICDVNYKKPKRDLRADFGYIMIRL